MSTKLQKHIDATKTKRKEYSDVIQSLHELRQYNVKLILGHGEISAVNPFFRVPKNKMVVLFVKVGCELGDTSSPILWNAIATDPDKAYVQKVLLTNEKAMPDDFLFKYKLIYPEGSYCPNIYTTLTCFSGMKTGVYDSKQISSMNYEDLPCVTSIYGKDKITTSDLIRHSNPKKKEIYVSYTCLFLRGVDNPFESVNWGEEDLPKERIKAVIDCSFALSKQAQHLFNDRYNMFPIRYTPSSVFDKQGVILREYDKKKYHDLRIYKIFESKGSNFWEKMSYYTGLKSLKENLQYKKYKKEFNSLCGNNN